MIYMRINVKPKPPDLYVDGRPVQNATTLGPYTEGSTFILDCRSSGGRPPPLITLWNGTRTLSAKSHVETTEDGASDVIVTARFVLSRWDLESRLECRVVSNATLAPMIKWIKLDIHVKPVSLRLRGPTTPVVAGEMVSLTCTVEGSRPAASITWFNRSREVEPQPPASRDLMSDATYRTSSTLVFIASRHDHQGDFCCQGLNEVQKLQMQPPLLQVVRLDVLCKFVSSALLILWCTDHYQFHQSPFILSKKKIYLIYYVQVKSYDRPMKDKTVL
ncbi:neural cell adhesion molecule 1-A [Trichonephila inaurata madagascariensis]|uniref:Neural cell adhesion molecule 1-A n=1 Tax=Trichonephila inaurata madagascariensis TaxID=2747483 RepID=A0A8X7CBI8_9ARAC|nr:neural cell adhesion molecule 1-A [Trichonephila inaurata madagascariensis]